MEKLQIKLINQNLPYKMSGQICMGKMKKQPLRKLALLINEKDSSNKDESPIFLASIKKFQKN
jgi:hypothetical protein